MLNRTQRSFNKIKETLLRQQKKVQAEIKALENEDPVLDNDLIESTEPGTDSWMADMHSRAVAIRSGLQDMLDGISTALKKLGNGKFGKCEKCGKDIEPARLKIMPTAKCCMVCSKKNTKSARR